MVVDKFFFVCFFVVFLFSFFNLEVLLFDYS